MTEKGTLDNGMKPPKTRHSRNGGGRGRWAGSRMKGSIIHTVDTEYGLPYGVLTSDNNVPWAVDTT